MKLRLSHPASLLAVCAAASFLAASEWPVYGGSNARAFRSADALIFPLTNAWSYQGDSVPVPAFKGMLAISGNFIAEPMRMDHAYYPVAAAGRVLFAAYGDECIVCLDAVTGATNWIYETDGAVRDAPTVSGGRVYFASDYGTVTCLALADGARLWSYTAAPEQRRIMVNERLGSQWPIRTGVTVHDGIAYFGCGLFSQMGAYFTALNAASGALVWRTRSDYSLIGPMLIDGANMVCPSGRASPSEWIRASGACTMPNHTGRRQGGSAFAGMLDDMLVYGPMESGFLVFRVLKDKDNGFQTIDGSFTAFIADLAVAHDGYVYVLLTNQLNAYAKAAFTNALMESVIRNGVGGLQSDNRFLEQYESDKTLNAWLITNKVWGVTVPFAQRLFSVIVVSNAVIVGGNNHVTAYHHLTGAQLWSAAVTGEAHALAVADGALFAGTSRGVVYGFRHAPTTFSHRVPNTGTPFSADPVCDEAVNVIIAHADRTNGVALVLGAGEAGGRLAYEIARRTQFYVIGIEDDTNKFAAARANLRTAGVFGGRVALQLVSLAQQPFPEWFANVIVSARALETGVAPSPAASVISMLQPYGGTLLLGSKHGALDLSAFTHPELSAWSAPAGATSAYWRVSHRGALSGAGVWDHQFADVENTACSADVHVSTNLVLQWFGRPGSEDVFDRHLMPMSPLFRNGLMFVSGKRNSLKAIDPYNGTRVWEITVPLSARIFQAMSGGFMCADDDFVYIVSSGSCWKVHGRTGARTAVFNVPASGHHWGYIATQGGLVYGSWLVPQATLNAYFNPKVLLNQTVDSARPLVSKGLFALTNSSGAVQWHYTTNSVIINQSIVIADELICFAESYSPPAVADPDNCVDLREFFATNAWIVALNASTGAELWRRPLARLNPAADGYEHIMYLQYAAPQRVLIATRTYLENISGTFYTRFRVNGLDPSSGTNIWERTIIVPIAWINTLTGTKSQATSHPTLANGKLYILPFAYGYGTMNIFDVATGAELHDTAFGSAWVNKGCAMRTASAECMFHRHTTMQGYHMASRQKWLVTRTTRPSCWQSVVPAGGLLLMPEGGSECVCGTSLSLSAAMAPAGRETTPPALVNALPTSPTNLTVIFSEALEQSSANTPANYAISGGVTVLSALRDPITTDRVRLLTSPMPNGTYTLTVNNIADLAGNLIASNAAVQFFLTDLAIVTSTNALSITEGSIGNFTVRLSAGPAGSVTVIVSRLSGDSSLSVVAGATSVFTSATYAVPQSVVIAAAEDDDTDNGTALFQCAAPMVNPVVITVTELDNDHGQGANGKLILRRGLNGYSGVMDAYLYLVSSNNFGASTTLLMRNDSTKRNPVFRWDISALPSDATITAAVLTFSVSSNPKTAPVDVFALLRPWTEGSGMGTASGDGVSWFTTDGATPWQTAGAAGATDRASVSLGTFSLASTGLTSCVLNQQGLALAQSWVGHPEANFGFITPGPNESGAACSLHSSESATDAARPTLTLYYALPAAGPQNPFIAINDGAGTTLVADVTLSLFAEDPDPVNVLLSQSPYFLGATQVTYQTSLPWTLQNPDGMNVIYAQFFDAETDPSDVVSASVYLIPEPSLMVSLALALSGLTAGCR